MTEEMMKEFERVKRREYMRRYYAKHREKVNAYQRERYRKKKAEKDVQNDCQKA